MFCLDFLSSLELSLKSLNIKVFYKTQNWSSPFDDLKRLWSLRSHFKLDLLSCIFFSGFFCITDTKINIALGCSSKREAWGRVWYTTRFLHKQSSSHGPRWKKYHKFHIIIVSFTIIDSQDRSWMLANLHFNDVEFFTSNSMIKVDDTSSSVTSNIYF
jgi:hypothetical protein